MVDQGGLELCRQQFQRPYRVRVGENGDGYEVFKLSLDRGGLTFSHFWCRRISMHPMRFSPLPITQLRVTDRPNDEIQSNTLLHIVILAGNEMEGLCFMLSV
jgi:hypothetical protein